MKEEWGSYLKSIGVVDLFYEKAIGVISFYEEIYPGEINNIFVSEYVDKDGQRQYENLWLFTEGNVLEAKSFLTKMDYDATPLKNCIKYWQLTMEEFEVGKSSAKSRMTLRIKLIDDLAGEMKASADNCERLWALFKDVIRPNLIKNE